MSDRTTGRDGLGGRWDDEREKKVQAEARAQMRRAGHRKPEEWPLFDEVVNDLRALVLRAQAIAKAKGKKRWLPIWNVLKRRTVQHVEGFPGGLFPLKDHYRRRIRQAYAVAAEQFGGSRYSSRELRAKAREVFMEQGDHRAAEAWDTYHAEHEQLSLFAPVGDETDSDNTQVHEQVADPKAVDPGEAVTDAVQLCLLDHLLEIADLTVRQRAISDILAHEEPQPTKAALARRFGVSKPSIKRDFDKILSAITFHTPGPDRH